MNDLNFSLERSTYFKNRSQLLTSKGVPKLSDAQANLGDSLAKVVFEQCEEALKEDFGLKVPLKGPGDMLWVSPSDLLIGKIALKPPFTPKCLQALTHKGILEIGVALETRFREEMEVDKQKTLEKYKAELLATVEDRMKSEIKDVELRERLNCQTEMEKQQQEFDLILLEELNNLESKIRVEYEKIITKNENKLKQEWKEKLQQEVKLTAERMTKEFLLQIEEQENKLTDAFQLELRKTEILRDFDAKWQKAKLTEAQKTLRHSLECRNLVNMMYILCTERRKCCLRTQEIENYYQKIINKLEEDVSDKDNKIKQLEMDKEHLLQEILLRENCLKEVIKHFQKFINFALRAAPTQAEFLLSLEKMMVFELAREITQSEFPTAHVEHGVIPWTHKESARTSTSSSDLEIDDYHNCLHELNPPTPMNGSEIGEDGTLPAMYFDRKMYVREDFRDMLSAGIKIEPNHEIWSRDVEFLIENWRKQSEKVQAEASEDQTEGEYVRKLRDDGISINATDRRRSKQSTVQFHEYGGPEPLRRSIDSKRASRKSSLRPAVYSPIEIEHLEKVGTVYSETKILAAKDSLEIIIERHQKSGMTVGSLNEENIEKMSSITAEHVKLSNVESDRRTQELVVETNDSVILRKSLLARHHHQASAEFNTSPKDSIEIAKCSLDKEYEVKCKPSKLTSARNSLDILKESISKLKEPSLICQKKDQQQQTFDQVSGFAETCCEHCKHKESLNILEEAEEQKILKPDSFSDEKSVKISRVQIINLDDHITAPSVVSFHMEPEYYKSTSSTDFSSDKKPPKKALNKRHHKNAFIRNKLKIVGDQQAKQGEQSSDEFTAERIHSLINLMRDQPQLMQLFTAGLR